MEGIENDCQDNRCKYGIQERLRYAVAEVKRYRRHSYEEQRGRLFCSHFAQPTSALVKGTRERPNREQQFAVTVFIALWPQRHM